MAEPQQDPSKSDDFPALDNLRLPKTRGKRWQCDIITEMHRLFVTDSPGHKSNLSWRQLVTLTEIELTEP